MKDSVDISVVVPIFNEAENLQELYDRLVKTLAGLEPMSFELIFVDDGSTDGGFQRLRELATADARVRAVRFVRNFGQHVALSGGIERSRGNVVILMDADLQNAPEDIPRFIAKIREGYDLVSGWRLNRGELTFVRRIGSALMNWFIGLSTGVPLHDYNCGFKAMTRRVAQEICRYGHLRRYIAPLLARLARSVAEVPVANGSRRQGHSKYTFLQIFALIVEFIIGFSVRPFQVIGLGGVACTLLGVLAGFAYFVGRLVFGMAAGDRLLASIILGTFAGIQFSILGLLGEYMVRAYHAAQNLPLYVVEEETGSLSGPRGPSTES
ncbi:MAG: glycosyltransferase family 2 protein [Nitrospinae bacterium]|nr:glycosyltransferase family 2 protein [Nitrospinota bacterium]